MVVGKKLLRRKFLKVLLGGTIVVFMMFGLTEIMMKIVVNVFPKPISTSLKNLQSAFEREDMRLPDNYTGNKFKPNFTIYIDTPEFQYREHTNPLIFDDVGFVDDGINGNVYGVLVGDSMSEGIGVPLEKKWIEIIEKNTGKDFVNMGFGALSTTQAVRVFDKWGTKLKPKIAIYQFNPTDLAEDVDFKEWLNTGSQGYYREFEARKKPLFELRRFLVKNFVTYQFFSFISKSDKNQFLYNDGNLTLLLNRKPDYSNERFKKGFETAKESLLFMKQRANETGIEMVIILIPLREQLYFELESDAKEEHKNIFWPQKLLMEFCAENSIRCYDTTLDFENYKNEQIYWTYDGHFNERGYALLADFTQKYLEKEELI